MLYVKVDKNNEPVGIPKTFSALAAEALLEGKILPREHMFTDRCDSLGYALVPNNGELLESKAGYSVELDVPAKLPDGTFERKYKYVQQEGIDAAVLKAEAIVAMKIRRKLYLEKFVDTISPLRWNRWTPEEQAEVTAWYEEVLNLPNAEGWPFVTLPQLPSAIKN